MEPRSLNKCWSSKDGGKGHFGQRDQDMQGHFGGQEHDVLGTEGVSQLMVSEKQVEK